MGDDDTTLTDDEIDALLGDEDDAEAEGGTGGSAEFDEEAIFDRYETISSSIQNVLSTILTKETAHSLRNCGIVNTPDLGEELQDLTESLIVIDLEMEGQLEGVSRYVLPESAALKLADVMMGQEGDNPPDELDDAYESALTEMYNQIANSLFNKISEISGENISAGAPEVQVIESSNVGGILDSEQYLRVSYNVSIEELIEQSIFYEIQPLSLAETIQPEIENEPQSDQQDSSQSVSANVGGGSSSEGGQQQSQKGEDAEVKSVDFPQFDATEGETSEGNMNMLMDVPMQVAVELGRTKLQVKEILNLGQGSIIELDRLAGEPVDLLVNGRLVARGEVVVIDESFGVRVTSIVSPLERIQQ